MIDIDCNKNENIDDNVFIKKFGSDPKKWNEDLGAFVVKTPSGGYHLYYQYEETLKHGQDAETNIDIRNDGGLILSAGCIRDGKKYEIIAGEIDQLSKAPDEVVDLIHSIEYYNPNNNSKSKKKTRVKKIKDKDGKNEIIIEEIIGCNQALYEYNFPEELLRDIIEGLDFKKYFGTYSGWLIFSTAMKQINRKDLWSEYSLSTTEKCYDEDQNERIYEGITGHKTMYAINHLLLNTSYKNARTSLDYFKLKPILKNVKKSDTKINREKLGYEYFKDLVKDDKKYFVIKSDTGTGKTTSFKSFMNDPHNKQKLRFLSIVSRVSLGLEQYETFNEEGIDSIWYENDRFDPGDNYVIQVDSLLKLKYWNDVGGTDGYVLFLDEFNSIIKHLFTSETLSKNGVRIPIMELLTDLIQNAKYVFMTDADISDQSLTFLDFVLEDKKDKMIYIENEYKHNSGKPAEELFDIDTLVRMMKASKKWICPCDEARSCHLLKELIGDEKILIIDSKVNERFDWDEYDRIIFSPKVIYGLDSIMERPVFCFYQESTIDPRDMLQQINRNRNITKLYYLFQRKKCREVDFNTLEDCMDDTNNLLKWCEKNDYLHQEISRVHPIFKDVFNQLKYNKDCYNSNPYAHFKKLLIERGFSDTTSINQSNIKRSKELLKADKERMIASINKDMPFVKKMNEYIGLPEDEIENYKEVFMNQKFIGNFLSLRRFIFDKYGETYNPENKKWINAYETDLERFNQQKEDMKNDLFMKEEFNIKKIQSNQSKMIYIDRLRRDLNMTNRCSINGLKLLNEEKAKEYYEEYRAIYTDRSKKDDNPLLNEVDTKTFIGKLYKKTFGINPFNYTSTSKDKKTIRKYQDAELSDFNEYYEIYELARKEYEYKKNMYHEGKISDEA